MRSLMIAACVTFCATLAGAQNEKPQGAQISNHEGMWIASDLNSTTKQSLFEIAVNGNNAVTGFSYEWTGTCGGVHAGARSQLDLSAKPRLLTANTFEMTDYIDSGPCKDGKVGIRVNFREKDGTATVRVNAPGVPERVTTWRISKRALQRK